MLSILIEPYIFSKAIFEQIQFLCRDFPYLSFYDEYFQDPYYKVWFARITSKIVGIIVMSRHSFNLYGDFLWVDQDYRNQGIGNRLLQFVEQYAREHYYRAIIGETPEIDLGAQRLYQRFGAENIGQSLPIYSDPFKMMTFRKKFQANLDHPHPIA